MKTKDELTQKVETFSREAIMTSTNPKVKEVLNRLEDSSFLERIRSYSETYWDKAWSNWAPPSALRDERDND